jgi:ketosteroid isomerase-like protein
MSEENVETIRRGYEAFGRRDLDAALEMADPAIEAHDPAEMPDAAVHRGKAAVKRDWEQTLELFDDFAIDIEEVFDAGEEVVLFLRYRGRGKESGAAVEVDMAHVLTMKDGMAVRLRQYLDRTEALAAAGVPAR